MELRCDVEDDEYWAKNFRNIDMFDFESDLEDAKHLLQVVSEDFDQEIESDINSWEDKSYLGTSNSYADLGFNTLSLSESCRLNSFGNLTDASCISAKTDVVSVVRSMLFDSSNQSNICLESFKTLHEKRSLLQESIRYQDSDVILTVLIFLRRTLNNNLFWRILRENSACHNIYANYLREIGDVNSVQECFLLLSLNEDALIHAYESSLSCKDNLRCISALRQCLETGCNSPEVQLQRKLMTQQLMLLEKQKSFQREDSEASTSCRISIADMILFLYTNGDQANVRTFCQLFDVCDCLALWTQVRACVRQKRWDAISSICKYNTWYGSEKMSTSISQETLCEYLYAHSAPERVIYDILSCVPSLRSRLELARKVSCYRMCVQTLTDLKDRKGLQELLPSLPADVAIYARSSLQSSTVKWKN